MAGTERNIIYYQGRGRENEVEKVGEIARNPHYTNLILSRIHMDETTGALSMGGTAIGDVVSDCWNALTPPKKNNRSVSRLLSGGVTGEVLDSIPLLNYIETSAQLPGQPSGNDWVERNGWGFTATTAGGNNWNIRISGVEEKEDVCERYL